MKTDAEAFLSYPAFAVVGVSADRKKFGNVIYREMRQRGLRVYAVNPKLTRVEEEVCYPTLAAVPEGVQAVVTVVPPQETEKVVPQCAARGVKAMWMQQGSSSDRAVKAAREAGMTVVHGHCLLMFLEPVGSVHRFHRWVWKLIGRYPR